MPTKESLKDSLKLPDFPDVWTYILDRPPTLWLQINHTHGLFYFYNFLHYVGKCREGIPEFSPLKMQLLLGVLCPVCPLPEPSHILAASAPAQPQQRPFDHCPRQVNLEVSTPTLKANVDA